MCCRADSYDMLRPKSVQLRDKALRKLPASLLHLQAGRTSPCATSRVADLGIAPEAPRRPKVKDRLLFCSATGIA